MCRLPVGCAPLKILFGIELLTPKTNAARRSLERHEEINQVRDGREDDSEKSEIEKSHQDDEAVPFERFQNRLRARGQKRVENLAPVERGERQQVEAGQRTVH